MNEPIEMSVSDILVHLVVAGLIGGLIGYERRLHHKVIGIAGMMLIAIGAATYMLLAIHVSVRDTAAVSRAIQGVLQGIGFLGAAAIFRAGAGVRGIKTAAAIWITGAIGMSIATSFWWLGILVGLVTAVILFTTDTLTPAPPQRELDDSSTGR